MTCVELLARLINILANYDCSLSRDSYSSLVHTDSCGTVLMIMTRLGRIPSVSWRVTRPTIELSSAALVSRCPQHQLEGGGVAVEL